MQTRYFALVLGIIFLLIGVMGFIPALVQSDVDHASHAAGATGQVDGLPGQPGDGVGEGATMEHGRLLGLFPVNAVHNLAHIAFGIWGVIAYRRWDLARFYARGVAILYGVLAIMGVIPGLNTMFGLMQIHGNDVWLHALIAVAAAYFGFAPARDTAGEGAVAPMHDNAVTH
jgi:hypothetical protein